MPVIFFNASPLAIKGFLNLLLVIPDKKNKLINRWDFRENFIEDQIFSRAIIKFRLGQ